MSTPPFLLDAPMAAARLGQLSALLHACVEDGASVNFVNPFTLDEAEAYWRDKVLVPVNLGTRDLFIAESDGRIVGTVQLDRDTPPNGRHRAEVTKLLVRPDHRRQGLGDAADGRAGGPRAVPGTHPAHPGHPQRRRRPSRSTAPAATSRSARSRATAASRSTAAWTRRRSCTNT
ncbi:MAG: GNAT family N-acetyltransferase [Rhodovibrio sp.]|nr:GNAT family N-acetyltransferase [Rhodovibrio sp.]